MWGGHNKAPVMNQEKNSQIDHTGALILDFPVSKTIEKSISVVYKPPNLWYFVIAAWMDFLKGSKHLNKLNY